MSGSGGGSGRIDGGISLGSGGSSTTICGSLDIETILNSPVEKVVEGMKRGTELSVEVFKKGPVSTLIAKDGQGRTAGSLTPPSLVTIINCIEKEFKYVAIILEDVDGGAIRVRIRGKK